MFSFSAICQTVHTWYTHYTHDTHMIHTWYRTDHYEDLTGTHRWGSPALCSLSRSPGPPLPGRSTGDSSCRLDRKFNLINQQQQQRMEAAAAAAGRGSERCLAAGGHLPPTGPSPFTKRDACGLWSGSWAADPGLVLLAGRSVGVKPS